MICLDFVEETLTVIRHKLLFKDIFYLRGGGGGEGGQFDPPPTYFKKN